MRCRSKGTLSHCLRRSSICSTSWRVIRGRSFRGSSSWTMCGELTLMWKIGRWTCTSDGCGKRSSRILRVRNGCSQYGALVISWRGNNRARDGNVMGLRWVRNGIEAGRRADQTKGLQEALERVGDLRREVENLTEEYGILLDRCGAAAVVLDAE